MDTVKREKEDAYPLISDRAFLPAYKAFWQAGALKTAEVLLL